jgi:hypothetical protein
MTVCSFYFEFSPTTFARAAAFHFPGFSKHFKIFGGDEKIHRRESDDASRDDSLRSPINTQSAAFVVITTPRLLTALCGRRTRQAK